MVHKKFFQLESIAVGEKKIYPIVLLKCIFIKKTFFNVEYEVSAIKIKENKKIYYKNVNLPHNDFEQIKKIF